MHVPAWVCLCDLCARLCVCVFGEGVNLMVVTWHLGDFLVVTHEFMEKAFDTYKLM